jgi:acyl-coenzyme A synthetase/AMP-(fatty) acid ligase
MADWAASLRAPAAPEERWPLVAASALDSTFAWRDGQPITLAAFLGDVAATAAALPPTRHALNACADRYAFTVALAACMQRDICTLLPPSRAPGVVQHLLADAPDLVLLVDADDAAEETAVPVHRVVAAGAAPLVATIPTHAGERIVARMFSSGSTGVPVPQAKSWSSLVRNGAAEVERLRKTLPQPVALLGTVPPQHSYGFESTVLVALAGGAQLTAARPFFPADIAEALAALPRPRGLVTTPFHLRTVLEAGVALPAADLIVCATAPLNRALAQAAEHAFGAPLIEIYGATESGQLATRRTAQQARWRPFSGVRVEQRAGRAVASGNHVPSDTPLADIVETHGDGRFSLLGRQADVVNIAGKRSSLDYLTQVLLRVPGVVDAAFFLPDESDAADITRVAAAAVAPGQTTAALLAALRTELDPVFLPRPLLLVDALPRSETSKLPVARLRALLAARSPLSAPARSEALAPIAQRAGEPVTAPLDATLALAADHPALAGHFPGHPIYPGVVLLDLAVTAIEAHFGFAVRELPSAKFLAPVRPGATVRLTAEQRDDQVRFELSVGGTPVARGAVRGQSNGSEVA